MAIAFLKSRLTVVLFVIALLVLLIASLTIIPMLYHAAPHVLAADPNVIVHNH